MESIPQPLPQVNLTKFKYTSLASDQYKLLGVKIGKGGTADIKLGYHVKSESYVALKILKKEWALDPEVIEEAKILMKLNHPNIIRAYDFQIAAEMIKPSGTKSKKTFFALEYASGGCLYDFVAQTGQFSASVTMHYFAQLVSAMSAWFKLGFCHRDLKPDNLLLDADFNLKVADFGFSCLLNKYGDSKLKTFVGTQGYMAPEMMARNQKYDGTKIDLFTCGLILFQMRTGKIPFQQATMKDFMYRLLNTSPEKYWHRVGKYVPKSDPLGDEFIDLVTNLLQKDPEQRYTVEQIQNHQYFVRVPKPADLKAEFSRRLAEINLQKQKLRLVSRNAGPSKAGKFRSVSSLPASDDSDDAISVDQKLKKIDIKKVKRSIIKSQQKQTNLNNLKNTSKSDSTTDVQSHWLWDKQSHQYKQRTVQTYIDLGQSKLNTYMVEVDSVRRLYEHLCQELMSYNRGGDEISAEDDEYVIYYRCKLEKGDTCIQISLYDCSTKSQETEGKTTKVIQFSKRQGCEHLYQSQLKKLKVHLQLMKRTHLKRSRSCVNVANLMSSDLESTQEGSDMEV